METGSGTFKGVLYALIAASLWGISGTFVQFLHEEKSISAAWLISMRMTIAGLILLSLALARKDQGIWKIWADPSVNRKLVLFSITGMFAVQFTFFMAIQHSNAATATVLQFAGPVLIALYYALVKRQWPTIREYIAIVFAITGTFLLVTHGNFKSLTISVPALVYGLLSAVALALYSIQPIPIMKKYGSLVVIGWAMLIGSIPAALIHPHWQVEGIIDLPAIGSIIFIIILGTVLPFYMYLSAVHIIGARKSSLIASAEPLSAAILAVCWLGVQFLAIDWIGAFLIVMTVFLLAKKPAK